MIVARNTCRIAHWLTVNFLAGQYAGRMGALLSTLQALKTNAAWQGLLDALFVLSGEPLLKGDVVPFHSHCDFVMQRWTIWLK